MRHSIKERFLNLDTFVIAPYFICLGVVGWCFPEHFIRMLGIGCSGAGLWYALANRIGRKRKGL